MSRLDDVLRDSLRREDPGPEFTSRVLARAAAEPARSAGWWERLRAAIQLPAVRWAAVGVAAALLMAAGIEYRREQRLRAEGEAAKQQLVMALRISGGKLRMAQMKVLELNR